MAFILTPYVAYTIYAEATHQHAEEAPAYPHLKIVHKRWPWEVDCAFFDVHCQQHWAETHKAGAAHH